jgi:hypothetical protein
MSAFDEREKGFEAKFKLDQDTKFKITSRRNKLLGLWTAGELGITGPAADAYAREVVAADFDTPGDDDVIGKIVKDAAAKGAKIDTARVKKEIVRLDAVAREQVLAEQKAK